MLTRIPPRERKDGPDPRVVGGIRLSRLLDLLATVFERVRPRAPRRRDAGPEDGDEDRENVYPLW